jgi:hypothetical protein
MVKKIIPQFFLNTAYQGHFIVMVGKKNMFL